MLRCLLFIFAGTFLQSGVAHAAGDRITTEQTIQFAKQQLTRIAEAQNLVLQDDSIQIYSSNSVAAILDNLGINLVAAIHGGSKGGDFLYVVFNVNSKAGLQSGYAYLIVLGPYPGEWSPLNFTSVNLTNPLTGSTSMVTLGPELVLIPYPGLQPKDFNLHLNHVQK